MPMPRFPLHLAALFVVAVSPVAAVFTLTMSAPTIRPRWGHATPQGTTSAALAVAGLVLCAVAALNAHRTRMPAMVAEPARY